MLRENLLCNNIPSFYDRFNSTLLDSRRFLETCNRKKRKSICLLSIRSNTRAKSMRRFAASSFISSRLKYYRRRKSLEVSLREVLTGQTLARHRLLRMSQTRSWSDLLHQRLLFFCETYFSKEFTFWRVFADSVSCKLAQNILGSSLEFPDVILVCKSDSRITRMSVGLCKSDVFRFFKNSSQHV